jgi:hypothetical protein
MPRRKIQIGPPSALDIFSKAMQITLPKDLAHQVAMYHSALEQAGVVGTPRDTLRELIALGLTNGDPASLEKNDRVQSLLTHKRWFLTKAHRFADDLQREMELELGLNPSKPSRG